MASWTRLRDDSWGVRGTTVEVRLGAVLTVTNSRGVASRVRVDRIVWTDRRVAIAAVTTLSARSQREEDMGSSAAVLADAGSPAPRVNGHAVPPVAPAPAAEPTVSAVAPAVTAEEIKRLADRSPCVIYTDVPESSGMPNPSAYFHRRGMVRVAWSDWACPYDRIPWTRINEYKAAGCNFVPVRIDTRDVEAFLAKLRQQCRAEIEQRFVNINKAIDAAPAEGEQGFTTAERVRGRFATAEQRLRKMMANLDAAEKLFGVTLYSGKEVAARLRVVGNRAELKARAYVAGTALLKSIDPTMAAAAANDDVEPGIMLDRLEEAGVETAGLRDAFADE